MVMIWLHFKNIVCAAVICLCFLTSGWVFVSINRGHRAREVLHGFALWIGLPLNLVQDLRIRHWPKSVGPFKSDLPVIWECLEDLHIYTAFPENAKV